MKAVLVYSCKAQEKASYDSDAVLRRKFYEWRFGEYERIERNEVLRELIYHPHDRSPREVWVMAEKFLTLAKSQETRFFFSSIAEKNKNKTLFY